MTCPTAGLPGKVHADVSVLTVVVAPLNGSSWPTRTGELAFSGSSAVVRSVRSDVAPSAAAAATQCELSCLRMRLSKIDIRDKFGASETSARVGRALTLWARCFRSGEPAPPARDRHRAVLSRLPGGMRSPADTCPRHRSFTTAVLRPIPGSHVSESGRLSLPTCTDQSNDN